MISVEEARNLVVSNAICLNSRQVELPDTIGSVLSDDVLAPLSIPPFNQSAMDGYALRFRDYETSLNIEVVGEVAAGMTFDGTIQPGSSLRIFTGAGLPPGVDTVVMQENVTIEDGKLVIKDQSLIAGSNVRLKGSQINKGEVALSKGTVISPGGIGYLAAMGINSVNVVSKPRITIIVTGSELQKPGTILEDGKIFESNSFALDAVLKSIGISAAAILTVVDDEKEIHSKIEMAINSSDIVLITGGISVGDYDFVGSSLAKIGVQNIFYKIKQKPGKPLFFGKQNNTLVYGLPGNPASVLSCFYEYVFPAIQKMEGKTELFLKSLYLPLSKNYKKKSGLSFFLKGKIVNGKAVPLDGQESFILSSFAIADSLIYLPAECENPKEGDRVEVHLLPIL